MSDRRVPAGPANARGEDGRRSRSARRRWIRERGAAWTLGRRQTCRCSLPQPARRGSSAAADEHRDRHAAPPADDTRPTLILSRTHDPDVTVEEGRWVALQMPDARFVELPGRRLPVVGRRHRCDRRRDRGVPHRPAAGPNTIESSPPCCSPTSSARPSGASQLGDRRWRELLDCHDAAVRAQLARFRGREINTAGDGFFALRRPGRAIRCAHAIADAVRELGLDSAPVSTPASASVGDDIGGIAVTSVPASPRSRAPARSW